MKHVTSIMLVVLLACSTASAEKPPDAAMLTNQAVETALLKFYAADQNSNCLIYRSIFTPGSIRTVNKKKVRVISRNEIEDGKEVALVRISKVTVQETDSVPAQLSVLITLVTWYEVGGKNLVPMHAFLTYEMQLDENADLKVVKESKILE